jgi:hypothetical protein
VKNDNQKTKKSKHQEEEVEKAWHRLSEAEKLRDVAELKVQRIIERATNAEQELLRRDYEMSLIATKRQNDEITRANRILVSFVFSIEV